MEVLTPIHLEDLDVSHATFARPDLTTFAGLAQLGLEVVGQRVEPDRAVLACRVTEPDQWCRRCGCEGIPRDTVTRRLAHEPFGWRPTVLEVTLRRYRCGECGHVWREDLSKAAEPRAKLSRRALRWALEGLVVAHLSVARIAEGLAVSWDTANNAVLAEGQRVLIADPTRFDGVRVLGVDEHVWRHTRRGDKYVTVIIGLTPIRDNTGPARLLDMVEGRSKHAFKTWLAAQPQAWRDQLEVVAMDGFTGFKTATTEELPDAVAVMDPFHVVRLAGDALDQCRRRVQQNLHGHRGRTGDPLFASRRMLHTGTDLLTDKQKQRLDDLFGADEHVEVEATWAVYQRMIAAYREPDRVKGRQPHGQADRLPKPRRSRRPERGRHARTDAGQASRRHPGLLRPPRNLQRPDGGDQRPPRTPPRHRPRLPQPDQLCRPITPRDRRIQTPTTPSIVMSHFRPCRVWPLVDRSGPEWPFDHRPTHRLAPSALDHRCAVADRLNAAGRSAVTPG
jgi:transposase